MLPLFSFYLITPFKSLLSCYLNDSIIKKARLHKLIKIRYINPRRFASDKHRTIDDKPFGGGPGMVYMLDPFVKAIEYAKNAGKTKFGHGNKLITYTILFSPEGKLFNTQFISDFIGVFIERQDKNFKLNAKCNSIKEIRFILVIPRYEGIDARIYNFVDISVSVGPFILTGAELPALIFIDSFVRFIPGVLGNYDSVVNDSYFEKNDSTNIIIHKKAPVYTRPFIYKSGKSLYKVPEVLKTGNHEKINIWRRQNSKRTFLKFLQISDFKLPC